MVQYPTDRYLIPIGQRIPQLGPYGTVFALRILYPDILFRPDVVNNSIEAHSDAQYASINMEQTIITDLEIRQAVVRRKLKLE